MNRLKILREYIKRQHTILHGVHWFARFTRPEWYLARAADDLIYLHFNRIACELQGRGKFSSDKDIMARVLVNKRIARGQQSLNSPIVVGRLGGETVEITHAMRK